MTPTLLNNRYRIVRELGSGAFADVLLAEDVLLPGRIVAIKQLRGAWQQDAEAQQRLLQEAQAASQLFHPHIAAALDVGYLENNQMYLAMRYVEGTTLETRLENGALNWHDTLQWATQIAGALDYAHARGILHRDVKPANIILSQNEGAVLTDFGVAHLLASQNRLTQTGMAAGSPAYIAPEIWQGKPGAPASDQYALACVIVESLTGTPLFDAPTPYAAVMRHTQETPNLPKQWAQGCPPHLSQSLLKALSKDPAQRYPSCQDFIHALNLPSPYGSTPAGVLREGAGGEGLPSPSGSTPAGVLREGAGGEGEGFTLQLAPSVSMAFIHIPAGEFLMGSKAQDSLAEAIKYYKDAKLEYYTDEEPPHIVSLSSYWIGKTPVTNLQFDAFVQATGYTTQAEKDGYAYNWLDGKWQQIKGAWWRQPRGANSSLSDKLQHPVVCVSWNDAAAFCAWVSKLSGYKISLPTEAQWEKAARGGISLLPKGEGQGMRENARIYPWGNQPPDETRCNGGMRVKDTTPVGKYSPLGDSPYGCVDMSGNVWEWCADWYAAEYYKTSPLSNPPGAVRGTYRCVRGGAWNNGVVNLRVANRNWYLPVNADYNIGFRCLRSP